MTTSEAPVAIVTGGGSGIGRATVLRLVTDGYRVVIADLHEANAEAVAREAALIEPERTVVVRVDVREEADVAHLAEVARDAFGRVDALVNNAGVGGAFGDVTEVAVEDWDFTFDVLVRGVFLGIKHVLPLMPDGASLINVASVAAFNGSSGGMAYSAAKAAVVGLTKVAAVELGPRSIRVNAVAPGGIRTPLLETGTTADALDRTLPHGQLLPRWGQPEDIAAAIAFLAGPDSTFITGETLLSDGGLVAAGPGITIMAHLGTDPRSKGLAGVNRGNTGQGHEIRKRAAAPDQSSV